MPNDPNQPTVAPLTAAAGGQKSKRGVGEMLAGALRSAVELRVITVVGDPDIAGEIDAPDVKVDFDGAQAIVTSINLVDGDITTLFSKANTAADRAWLRDYHEKQIAEGREIVSRNLEMLAEIGKSLAAAMRELKKEEKEEGKG